MKKRVIAAVTAAAAALACLSSCGKKEIGRDGESASSQVSEQSEAETGQPGTTDPGEDEEPEAPKFTGELKAPVADGKIDLSQGATENMLIRSVAVQGDTSRLAAKLKKAKEIAESKEYTTQEKYNYPTEVVFMGDSVTTGYNASGDKKFASQFQTWWENNISFYAEWENEGLIATDSYVGVHRVDSDVLVHQPDIIFIEFVNDTDSERCRQSMDSLLRKCMSDENMPAVILIETMWQDGSSPQDMHQELAEAYNIPMISLRDAVMPEIDAGNLTWEELFADEVHPNDLCHGLIAQMLENYVESVRETADSAPKPTAFSAASPTGDIFKDAMIADQYTGIAWVSENNGFDEGGQLWYLQNGWGTVTGGDITFVVTCKKLGMMYNMSTSGDGGTARIIVDNKVVADIDSDFSGGWGDHCETKELFDNKEAEEHYITVKVPKGKRFEVVRLLID